MDEKEQSNTMLYVVVFIGLIVIGVVKAIFGNLFSTSTVEVDWASVIVTEILGAALMGGLFVYIIQSVTAPAQKLNDKFEVFSQEQERLRTVQEKILETGTHPAVTDRYTKPESIPTQSAPTQSTPPPKPVATKPAPPPEPPQDPFEAQLEQELESVHFDDMFAEYKAERDEARARGESIDDEDGGTAVSDSN